MKQASYMLVLINPYIIKMLRNSWHHVSGHGPSNVLNPNIRIQRQRIPHGLRPIHHVVPARRLTIVLTITPVDRVTLVHHLRRHAPPVRCGYPYHLQAPRPFVVPPGGECHHELGVRVVILVALGGAAAVAAFAEVVEC